MYTLAELKPITYPARLEAARVELRLEDLKPWGVHCELFCEPQGLFGRPHAGCRKEHPRKLGRWCEACVTGLLGDLDATADSVEDHDFDADSLATLAEMRPGLFPDPADVTADDLRLEAEHDDWLDRQEQEQIVRRTIDRLDQEEEEEFREMMEQWAIEEDLDDEEFERGQLDRVCSGYGGTT